MSSTAAPARIRPTTPRPWSAWWWTWPTAAALATLHIMQREDLVARSAEMGAYLGQKLKATLSDHPHVGDVRGRGQRRQHLLHSFHSGIQHAGTIQRNDLILPQETQGRFQPHLLAQQPGAGHRPALRGRDGFASEIAQHTDKRSQATSRRSTTGRSSPQHSQLSSKRKTNPDHLQSASFGELFDLA